MDETILSSEKQVLVGVVKMAQKQRLKGDKGGWKDFLTVHDTKLGTSMSDPAKRSVDDLVAFLKTFSKEEDLKFFATMVRGITKCAAVKQLSESSTEAESPQQKLVRSTIQHPDYLLNYSFPSKNEEWVATKLGKSSKAVKSNSMVAVDCEMVLCQDNTEALVQVCVVDENMEVKLNELVNPNKAIADYRTDITGLSAKDLEGVTCTLANVQKKMKKLLRHGTILVGHSLSNDLHALKLDHARVIDTSYIFEGPTRRKLSLNDLCKTILGYEVRKDGAPHNCLDDARAAMKLIIAKLEHGFDGTISCISKHVPESESAKLLLHGISMDVPKEELRRIFPGFTFEFQDSFGRPQKYVVFERSTGLHTTLFVRKMAPDGSTEQSTSKKRPLEENKGDGSLVQCTPTKKRSAEVENRDECEHHIKEIERLKKELRQRDDEVANLQKIMTALTRKQGL
ncbi:hypothetical protein IFM89_029143 [Coptis chinensis]|uniref:Exonuclease domain-containing protein n=1 Tax=Coptis chinensis TaxID=261450 RepID=A0A835M6W2_9MAGN|nr:hypothetical protein IFM89_029143 [Coptis chinensis]